MNKLEQVLGRYMPTQKAKQDDFITVLNNLFRKTISKSEVMKRAHRLFKKGVETFSEALKQSWAIEKSKVA
jgi:hypothetical protein